MSKRLLFIYNPNSGTSRKSLNDLMIKEAFRSEWKYDIIHTAYPGHAREIAEKSKDSYDVVTAIGGDGTVNEIASALVDTDTVLAIVPRGSGNGLSRFLRLPMSTRKAFEVIKSGKVRKIDTMAMNEHRFVNMAGVGFDAHIAHLFKDFGARGFISYSRLVLKEFRQYPGVRLKLKVNGTLHNEQAAFVVSFANSSQYGNNAHIAPGAAIDDGLMDVCIVKKFPLIESAGITTKLFSGSINRSKYYQSYQAPDVYIEADQDLEGHVDGEPVFPGRYIRIKVYRRNLKVIVP